MKSKPFRFLENAGRIERLRSALRTSGYELRGRSDIGLTFVRAGRASPVEIVWELDWWPDGQVQQDRRITVRRGSRILADIDVAGLLRSKLSEPLAQAIVRRVALALGHVDE
jgi:hypothetical protein